MVDRNFYEDDEPIEDIERTLARPADGVTEPPAHRAATVFLAPHGGEWESSTVTTQAAACR